MKRKTICTVFQITIFSFLMGAIVYNVEANPYNENYNIGIDIVAKERFK